MLNKLKGRIEPDYNLITFTLVNGVPVTKYICIV